MNPPLKLSERRAVAVQKYLLSRQVAQDKIEVHAKGKSMPVASNQTASGKAQNRRVTSDPIAAGGVKPDRSEQNTAWQEALQGKVQERKPCI